jgi:GNAT superfamily N-acetyltransferase
LPTSPELDRILAFSHGIAERSSTRLVPFAYGTALFNDAFPLSWAHNFLRVDRPRGATASDLIAEAERLHRASGHRHRMIDVENETAGARLAPDFRAGGWTVERSAVMVRRRGFDREIDTSVAAEMSFEEVRPAFEEYWRACPDADTEEAVRQLTERNLVTAEVTAVRHFGVRVRGRVVTTCDLYSDGRTAQVEEVWTREDHRGRGFGRAAVALAIEEALKGGCDLVWLFADADDWPKQLYAKLGFEEIARTYGFSMPGPKPG